MSSGRRKTASALAIIYEGRGIVNINRQPLIEYFIEPEYRRHLLFPVELSDLACLINIDIHVTGSGLSSQAQACRIAVARCLIKMYPELKTIFKKSKNIMKGILKF